MSTTTSELNRDQKRCKIAEAVGWRYWHDDSALGYHWTAPSDTGKGEGKSFNMVPDYFGSLDAMHAAVDTLSKWQQICFCYFLFSPDGDKEYIASMGDNEWLESPCSNWFPIFNATAAQRAEAFGKALNLW